MRTVTLCAAILFTGLTVGCGGDPSSIEEDDFLSEYIELGCETEMECDDTGFFESSEECEQFFVALGFNELGEGCDYDGKQARTCLDELQTLTCGELDDDSFVVCDTVYTGSCAWTE